MVEEAKEDDDGVVRTVTVAFRPRNKRDTGRPYVSKMAQKLTIGVQRFAVLLATDEVLEHEEKEDELYGIIPPRVRDDVKLGGLGHAVLGRSRSYCLVTRPVLPSCMRIKLPGPRSRGTRSRVGSVRRVSWPSCHEVKLSGPGTGGERCFFGSVRRVSWPSIMR